MTLKYKSPLHAHGLELPTWWRYGPVVIGIASNWIFQPVPAKDKTKVVAFFASNCGTGGADIRLNYVKELMNYIDVDSYGGCLHNKDYKKAGGGHPTQMREKVRAFSKFCEY